MREHGAMDGRGDAAVKEKRMREVRWGERRAWIVQAGRGGPRV